MKKLRLMSNEEKTVYFRYLNSKDKLLLAYMKFNLKILGGNKK